MEANDTTQLLAYDWSLSQCCCYIYTLQTLVHKVAARGAVTTKPVGLCDESSAEGASG